MLLPLRPESANAYRVPKYEVSVEIAIRGQAPEQVSLFLGARAQGGTGFERPSDLLSADEAFLPIRVEGSETRLVRKGAIAWFAVPRTVEEGGREDLPHLSTHDRQHVEVVLEDGRTLAGEVLLALPDGRRRVQDFLNASGPFFEVRTEARVLFVNRDHVVAVKPRG